MFIQRSKRQPMIALRCYCLDCVETTLSRFCLRRKKQLVIRPRLSVGLFGVSSMRPRRKQLSSDITPRDGLQALSSIAGRATGLLRCIRGDITCHPEVERHFGSRISLKALKFRNANICSGKQLCNKFDRYRAP